MPASACRRKPMICSSLYFLVLMSIILRVGGLFGKMSGEVCGGQVILLQPLIAISNKASSAARSDSPNHCCKQWMRSIISRSKGGRPVLATGAHTAINATSSAHGITCPISSGSTSLQVRRVLRFRPRPLLFHASIVWQTCLPIHRDSCRVLNMISRLTGPN